MAISTWLTLLVGIISYAPFANGEIPNTIGVNYGTLGDNLPSPAAVVAMYRRYKIDKVRIFNPNHDILQALVDSQKAAKSCIYVTVGVANNDIPAIAGGQPAANSWVQTNIVPYGTCVNFVADGNEAVSGPFSASVAPAMRNLRAALDGANLHGVRVTTVVNIAVLGNSYPPSKGVFSATTRADMGAILAEIARHGTTNSQKIMVNVYPYFAYAADPTHISPEYAGFTATKPVVTDGNLSYLSLFDAMVDAFYSAMENSGHPSVGIIVSESGWPSAGNGGFTTKELARTYNTNLRARINAGGTPKRPNAMISTFVFAMFNEDQKPAGVEQNWGLFYPDGTPVYPFF